MSRGDLNEAEWLILKDLLPPERGRKSRPASDNRPIINGILWRTRTATPWRDVPEKYGKWMTLYQRLRRWRDAGIREAVATILAQAIADNSRHSIDSAAFGAMYRRPVRSNWITPIRWNRRIYLERNRIERMIGHLKINRTVATRYDKLASSFLDSLHLASIHRSLRHATS